MREKLKLKNTSPQVWRVEKAPRRSWEEWEVILLKPGEELEYPPIYKVRHSNAAPGLIFLELRKEDDPVRVAYVTAIRERTSGITKAAFPNVVPSPPTQPPEPSEFTSLLPSGKPYCPECGQTFDTPRVWKCPTCGFEWED